MFLKHRSAKGQERQGSIASCVIQCVRLHWRLPGEEAHRLLASLHQDRDVTG
jgi:hypothetical protein